MNQLRQRVSTSEDQICEMSPQFNSIKEFIGTVLQYLAPPATAATQNIFHQVDRDAQNQQPTTE